MKELFVMLAKALSQDECIERLEEAISDFKEAKLLNQNLEKAEFTLHMACHLLIFNTLDGNASDIIKNMDEVNRSVNFFKTEKN